MRYSIIHHDLRERFDLTISEYLVCDSIYQCSHNAPTKKTNKEFGEFLGIDNSHVGSVKKKLLEKWLITDDQNGSQTTELWNDSVVGESGKIPTKVGKSQKNWENPNHSLYNKVNTIIGATREYDIVSETEHSKPDKKEKKYPHSKEVFSWFPKPEKSWALNTTELKHSELLWERGETAVKRALKYHQAHKEDEGYGYVVVKPSQLEGKWNDIAEYARRTK